MNKLRKLQQTMSNLDFRPVRTLLVLVGSAVVCVGLISAYLNSDSHLIHSGAAPRQAIAAKQRLDTSQAELKGNVTLVSVKLKDMRTKLDASTVDLDRLSAQIPDLKLQADWLIDNRESFVSAARRYSEALEVALAKVDKVSGYYFKKAESQSYESNKQSFIVLGNAAKEQAKRMRQSVETLNTSVEQLNGRLDWVREAKGFLIELEGYLEFHKSGSDAQVVNEFVNKLNGFINEFEQVMEQFSNLDSFFEKPGTPSVINNTTVLNSPSLERST